MSNSNEAAPNHTENASIPIETPIRARLQQLAALSDSCCIYRVPERIRCFNPNMYTPKVISIGPLHHGKETLQEMEEHKYRYLQRFLDRTGKDLEYYIQKIKKQEAKLRGCYAETIKFSSNDFVTIILVDSAFIIELFLNQYIQQADNADRIIRKPELIYDIKPDLLLLENQLPLFILEDLFDPNKVNRNSCTSNPGSSEQLSFIQLSRHFFTLELADVGFDTNLEMDSFSEVNRYHFLDFVRKLCLPPEPLVGRRRNAAAIFAPSITELHRAGVKFKVGSTGNLFGIRFDNETLEIPKLSISHGMEHTFRNLAAFEQCHYRDCRIAEYLDLIDCFVDTPKDVELLVKYGIVRNILGDSSEASSLINNLCKGLCGDYDDFCFATLNEDLHNHCKKPWNKWKANLRHFYLNTPWAIVSVVAAAFLIILTVIQTVCSIISL